MQTKDRSSIISPRCMTLSEAASYLNYSARTFSRLVRKGMLPGPLPGTQRYDRKALDGCLDRLSGLSAKADSDLWITDFLARR